MNLHLIAILMLYVHHGSCEKLNFVENQKFNYITFQFPSLKDEQEALKKDIYSTEAPRNQIPYDIDIQYYSESL